MKFVVASDIHGSAYWTERLMEVVDRERPDRVLLLGDLLYHGPRNDLPRDYAPKRVIELLNGLDDDGRELFCTHGHVFGAGKHNSTDRVPQLPEGSALLFATRISR